MADDIQSPTLPDVPFVDDSADAFPSFRGHNQGAELLSQAISAQDLVGTEHYLQAMVAKGFHAKAAEAVVAAFAGSANLQAWTDRGSEAIFPVKLIKALAKVPAVEAEVQKSPEVLLRAVKEQKWGLGPMLLNRGYSAGSQVEKFMHACVKADKAVLLEKYDAVHPGETAKVMATAAGSRLLSAATGELAARYFLDKHYPAERLDLSMAETVATYNVTVLRLMHERGDVLPTSAQLAFVAVQPNTGLFATLGSTENQEFFRQHYLPGLTKLAAANPECAVAATVHACRDAALPVLKEMLDVGMPLPTAHQIFRGLENRESVEDKLAYLRLLRDEGLEPPARLDWTHDRRNLGQYPKLSENTLAHLAVFGFDGKGGFTGLAEQLATVSPGMVPAAQDQLAERGISINWDDWNLARAVASNASDLDGYSLAAKALKGEGSAVAKSGDTWNGLRAVEYAVLARPDSDTAHYMKGWRADIDGTPAIQKLVAIRAERALTDLQSQHAQKVNLRELLKTALHLQGKHDVDIGLLGRTADGKGLWQNFFEQTAARAPDIAAMAFANARYDARAVPGDLSARVFSEVSPEGDTLVHLAAKHGLLAPMKVFLLDAGFGDFVKPSLDSKNHAGQTPLDVAKTPRDRALLADLSKELAAQRERERAAAAERERQGREKLVAHLAGVSESGRTIAVRFTYHDMTGGERDATAAAASVLRWSMTPDGVAKVATAPLARADTATDAQHRARVVAAAQRLVDAKAQEVFTNERERLAKEMDRPAVASKGPAKTGPAR